MPQIYFIPLGSFSARGICLLDITFICKHKLGDSSKGMFIVTTSRFEWQRQLQCGREYLAPEALVMHRNVCTHSRDTKMCSQWPTAIHLFPTYSTLTSFICTETVRLFPDKHTANPLYHYQTDCLITTVCLVFSYPYPLNDYSVDFSLYWRSYF